MDMALSGLKVLDLTRVLAGPFCTMILADLGAEVIKIERPETGDDSRAFGPFIGDESMYFNGINRNKKSVELNLKAEEDREVFMKMAKEADVLVENFRPGSMEKLGFSYEELKKVNPTLIYATSSGFGHSGPYSDRPAYDLIIQALAGTMSITGHPDGPPTKVGSSVADIIAGIYTAVGITSALYYREQKGEGQFVDVSMMDCQVSVLENAIARYFATGENPGRIGNRHPSITPFAMYNTKDSQVIIAAGSAKLWEDFCRAIGKPELLEDERFKDNRLRTENVEVLEKILEEVFAEKTTREWLDILEGHSIPCAPVNEIEDVVNDPQIKAREMIQEIEHPKLGKVKLPGIPIKFSKTPGKIRKAAPSLGENNKEYKGENESFLN